MAPTTQLVRSPIVKIGGSALTEDIMGAVLRLDVRLNLHSPSIVEIELIDPHFAILDREGFAVGDPFVVELPGTNGQHASVFDGKLTSLGIEQEMHDGVSIPRLVLEARDASHAFPSSTTYTAYLQGASDVVKAIAGRHGLSAKIEGTPVLDKYVVQARTDLDTLNDLARLCDYEWFVRGRDLHFRSPLKPASGVTLSRTDRTLWRFSVRYSGVDVPGSVKVHGSGLDGASSHTGTGASALAADAVGSDAPIVSQQFSKAKTAFGKPLAVGAIPTRDSAAADKAAQAIARGLVRRGLRAEGLAPSTPGLVPGEYVSIAEMGTTLSGKYYLTEVHHSFSSEKESVTTFVCGGDRPSTDPATTGWSSDGPVVGVVSNTNDPDSIGRVKVKFPSLADAESDWARVVSIGAGADRGIDFRPEVNDEVLVVFEHGDPRFPLVLGGLWNKNHKHPLAGIGADNKVEQRVIRSRTGHKVTFGDGSGDADKHVTIELTNGTKLVLSQADGALLDVAKGDVVLKTKQGSIKLTEQGDLTVDANKVDVKAKSPVSIDGKATVAVKGTGGLKLEGTSQFEVKGGMGKVEASGVLQVKGAMVKIN